MLNSLLSQNHTNLIHFFTLMNKKSITVKTPQCFLSNFKIIRARQEQERLFHPKRFVQRYRVPFSLSPCVHVNQ